MRLRSSLIVLVLSTLVPLLAFSAFVAYTAGPASTVLSVGAVLIVGGIALALLLGRRIDRTIRDLLAEAAEARARAEEELRSRAGRQAALADFGRRALTGGELAALMDDAARVVAEVLAVECVALLELRADGLHLRAGAGWPAGTPGVFPVTVGLDAPSHAVVVIADVPAQADFPVPAHLRARGVGSGLTVVVGGVDAAWGVLGAYTADARAFMADDVSFLQALANELGTLIQREGAQAALRTTQEQLAQSQKMEAVGRLAGGLAHDFNNLLTVIAGRAQLLSDSGALDAAQRRSLELILESTRQAATVTRQLLAFSRRQVLQPQVIDLHAILGDMEALLRGLIGEDVELAVHRANGLGRVRADPGQVAQVILNLVVNARDAMPAGGRLAIETRNTTLDEADARAHPDVEPGRYVILAVTDTGIGMDETVRSRIFEPFFTTKQVGKGTGLGLATVYGTVRQSGGYVWVDSELGHGSTFTIYLPRVDEPLTPATATPTVVKFLRGTETVMVVEDEPEVRRLACDLLESEGYTVLEAGTPAEALDLASSHQGVLDLVVTDVVMPGMSGPELVERVVTLRPSTRILFMSGYTEEAMVHRGHLDARAPLLEKPFTTSDFVAAVRRVLDT